VADEHGMTTGQPNNDKPTKRPSLIGVGPSVTKIY